MPQNSFNSRDIGQHAT